MKFLWAFLFVLSSGIVFSQSDEDTTIYEFVDQQAEFPGGPTEIVKFIARNLRVPQEAIEMGVEGKAAVQFVVEKDGNLSRFTFEKHTHEIFKEPISRVLKSMPKWIPAQNKGKVVRSLFYLPITCIKLE